MEHEDPRGLPDASSAVVRFEFKKRVLKRLPITFRPYFNGQLRNWNSLFPYERRYLLRILADLDRLDDQEWSRLFIGIVDIETKMGVSAWNFSAEEQTLEGTSRLARSPHYAAWRQEVEKVWDRIDREFQAQKAEEAGDSPRPLILIILPASLPLESQAVWKRWPQNGNRVQVDLGASPNELALTAGLFGRSGENSGTFWSALMRRGTRSHTDICVLDAGERLTEFLLAAAGVRPSAVLLSYERLKTFREKWLAELNLMSHSLSSADEIYDRLKKTDIASWCPPEVKADPLVREFVRSLFLSGNGAPVFSNSFVQWGAAEIFRRARPSVAICALGFRDKPKPFTSVAIFENQESANPTPSVKDLRGSALDAELLAYYIALAAGRYPEYQNALTICLAASLNTAYILGPDDSPFHGEAGPLALREISDRLGSWLDSNQPA